MHSYLRFILFDFIIFVDNLKKPLKQNIRYGK